ncbi:MAG TPA: CoA transferase [Burkholderiales bacterium]|nr:CoA transferase [Burkholderiales bacterium]
MPGPLSGVKVLDLTTVVMGPFATQLLSELGADVIKVEPHDGDNMRHPAPMKNPGMGYIFLNLNRGKRGIVLDLKKPEGHEALMRLIPQADVLIYNVRPQAMARLGLSYEALRKVNPKIIYVGAYGYSQRGPYAAKAAYDDLIQGISGIPSLVKKAGAAAPAYAPVNLADRVTGLHAVYAVTAALFHRERTGEGQSVEVPMFESLAHFVLGDHSAGETFDPPSGDTGYARLLARKPYQTSDGYLCILVYNDKQWKSFADSIGQPDLMQDPRFATQANRARHISEIYAWLAKVIVTRTTAEWMALMEKADIPVAPVNDIADLVEDPHLAATGFFSIEEHPSEGGLRTMRTPTSWSASPPGAQRPAPRLGEHSAEVLKEAGFSDAEIAEMVRTGATKLL